MQNSPNMRHKKSPIFGIGSSERPSLGGDKESLFKPGPNVYNSTLDFKKSAPFFVFGKESRQGLERTKHQSSPGPGMY